MREVKLVIIDADSLVYQSSKETLEESIVILREKVENIFLQTRAEYYVMFISLGNYFRNKIDVTYKRRKYDSPLKWVRTLKNYLIEHYGAIGGKDVEADDLCAYFMNIPLYYGSPELSMDGEFKEVFMEERNINSLVNPVKVRTILASPDKDLLKSIPTTSFNYTYKSNPLNADEPTKGFWVTTSESEADEFLRSQLICGDASDGVIGLRGKANAYWKKISKDTIPTWGDLLQEYISHFGDVGTAIYRFQSNYRLLKILNTESDFFREVGYIPTIEPREVIFSNQINEVEEQF